MNEVAERRGRQLDLAVALLCALAAIVIFLAFHQLRHDDDFITYRYGLNLAEGRGLVFNPGQRVLGTTSPLFALVSAGLYAVVGKGALPDAAVGFNALALALQAFLLFWMLRRRLPATAVVVALFTLAGAAVPFGYLGLETHTYVALLLASLLSVWSDRPVLGGVLTGLAFLARNDAVLLVPLLLLRYRRRESKRGGLAFLAAAAATVAPWLLFATLYYGWPVPRTLEAKAGMSSAAAYLAAYGERFLTLPGVQPTLAVHLLAAGLALLGLWMAIRRLPTLTVFAAFGLALFLGYAAIGPPLTQTWHMYPATLAVRVLMLVGIFGTLEGRGGKAPARGRAWRLAAVALVAAAWLVPVVRDAVDTSRQVATAAWFGGRHARYEQVAAWLLEHAGPDRSLLAVEVGTLGYLTGYEMLDPFGLVTPTAGDPEDAAHMVGLMWEYRPDLVLVHAPWQGAALEGSTPYRTVHVFPWLSPWSTLLARAPSVLRRPEELPRLRSQVEELTAPDASPLPWVSLEGWQGAPPRPRDSS